MNLLSRRGLITATLQLSNLLTSSITTTRVVRALSTPTGSPSSTITTTTMKVIDSHLHVWASSLETSEFPYSVGNEPPSNNAILSDGGSVQNLLTEMDKNNVDGALIVQPINHKFDHSYVAQKAIQSHPDRFKGMLLFDPSLSTDDALTQLDQLSKQGFVGVRFNPYLWPKQNNGDNNEGTWMEMSTPNSSGLEVYKKCAQLNMPVGVMCFQGLELHYDDIIKLISASPDTTLILDHFGFTKLTSTGDDAFQKLLSLAKYPNVYIKISALFRLDDVSPYNKVRTQRFEPLIQTFGPTRLMYGSDFPFVLEQEPEKYGGMLALVSSWLDDYDPTAKAAVMGGTAEKVFGPWGSSTKGTATVTNTDVNKSVA